MRRAGVLVAVALSGSLLLPLPTVALTRGQMRDFPLTAKITRSRDIGKGVTSPKRLTLTDGTLTHDAAFQAVDLRQTVANLTGGGRNAAVEMDFVDAYRYNLGAYAIAEMLGVGHMMPVHVERRRAGKSGSLSWWVDTLMDEGMIGVRPRKTPFGVGTWVHGRAFFAA